MHGKIRFVLLVVFGSACADPGFLWLSCAQPAAAQQEMSVIPAPSDADVPLAPILPIEAGGWTNALRLANTNLELIVSPALGRITSLRFRNSENLLRFDAAFAGFQPEKKQAEWVNAGGEWLWPMAQSAWPRIAEADWPPPPVLADAAWSATAWTAADGSLNCMLTRQYGRPLYLKASRLIRLDPEKPVFSIRQRIERTRTSDAPVSLWNIFQIAGARMVCFPTDEDSAWDGGFRPIMFAPPPSEQWARCDGIIIYRSIAGEHKFCSDSKRAWIAACRDDAWIAVKVQNESVAGFYPDGGCVLEMYSNAGLGYTEIETLSPEVTLDAGGSLQNEIIVRCLAPIESSDACDTAKALRSVFEPETAAAPAVSGEDNRGVRAELPADQ